MAGSAILAGEQSVPRKRARWSTHPDVPSPVHPSKMRLPFPNPSPDTGSADPSVHRTGAEDRGARAADCISAPREAQCPQRRRAINFGTHKGEGRERRNVRTSQYTQRQGAGRCEGTGSNISMLSIVRGTRKRSASMGKSQETVMQDVGADTKKRGPSSRVLQEIIRQVPAERARSPSL